MDRREGPIYRALSLGKRIAQLPGGLTVSIGVALIVGTFWGFLSLLALALQVPPSQLRPTWPIDSIVLQVMRVVPVLLYSGVLVMAVGGVQAFIAYRKSRASDDPERRG